MWENCIFNIEDYKISLYKCDNDHNNSNILFEEFNKTQEIDESKINCNLCGQCKIYSYDSKFFKCCDCNAYLCLMCKQKHDKAHVVIDYDLKNYLCNIHGERYTSYCYECHKNLCDLCELKHDKYHKLINHRDIIKDNQDNTDDLKIRIDELKKEVNNMIEKLYRVVRNMEIYYNISKDLVKNNNFKNRNYQILMNHNQIFDYNRFFINEIDYVLKENLIENKFKNIIRISELMIAKRIDLGSLSSSFNNNINKNNNNNVNFNNNMPNNMLNNGMYNNIPNADMYNNNMYYNNYMNNNMNNNMNNAINSNINRNVNNDNIILAQTKIYQSGKYVGEIKNEKRDGKGIMYYNDGTKYEGEQKNDNREGYGVFTLNYGDRYEGHFINNKYEGKGKLYYRNGDKYEGDFHDDNMEGKGIMHYKTGDKYEGDWKNGLCNGKGIIILHNGDKYEGNWKNGKFEGKGVYYYSNGDRYEGDWRQGICDGKGVFYYSNGDREMGDFLNGLQIGTHAKLLANGKVKSQKH